MKWETAEGHKKVGEEPPCKTRANKKSMHTLSRKTAVVGHFLRLNLMYYGGSLQLPA